MRFPIQEYCPSVFVWALSNVISCAVAAKLQQNSALAGVTIGLQHQRRVADRTLIERPPETVDQRGIDLVTGGAIDLLARQASKSANP